MKRMKTLGFTLINILATIAIILILAGVLYYGIGNSAETQRADKLGKTTIGRAKLRAKDTECQSNLRQVRMMLQMQPEDSPAQSLQDINLPENFKHCPIGHENYIYDSATGQVTCPHPGHERY